MSHFLINACPSLLMIDHRFFRKHFLFLVAVLFISHCASPITLQKTTVNYIFEITDRRTTEDGKDISLQVRLDRNPGSSITIELSSSDPTEGTVIGGNQLVFTTANWNKSQNIKIQGKDDSIEDGHVSYDILFRNINKLSGVYAMAQNQKINLVNEDNESARIIITWPIAENERYTDENGRSIQFSMAPDKTPDSPINIFVTTTNTREAEVSGDGLFEFTGNQPQTVTIIGKDDQKQDGTLPYSVKMVVTTQATRYKNISVPEQKLVNRDNDNASIKIIPSSPFYIEENGVARTFNFSLGGDPEAIVNIDIETPKELNFSDLVSGTPSTDNKKQLSFYPSSASITVQGTRWNVPQAVTFTAKDDSYDSGPHTIMIPYSVNNEHTLSENYLTLPKQNISLLYLDNDSAQIDIIANKVFTYENKGEFPVGIDLSLASDPSDDVNVKITSLDLTEAKVSCYNDATNKFSDPNSDCSHSFKKYDASTGKTVKKIRIHGQADNLKDGPQSYKIQFEASSNITSNLYNGMKITKEFLNIDANSPGIIVTQTSYFTSEPDETTLVSLRLAMLPDQTVDVPLRLDSSADFEAEFDTGNNICLPNALTTKNCIIQFTPQNWEVLQTITLKGLDDNKADREQKYTLFIDPITSAGLYQGYDLTPDILLYNLDNEKPYIDATIDSQSTFEGNPSKTSLLQIALSHEPLGSVRLDLSLDTDEAKFRHTNGSLIATQSAVFDSTNWNARQNFLITGQDDFIADNSQTYTLKIDINKTGTTALAYKNITSPRIQMVNVDNDQATIISDSSDLITSEVGDLAHVNIKLSSQPIALVTFTPTITPSTVARITKINDVDFTAGAGLTFDATNWNVPQKIVLQGLNDSKPDTTPQYKMTLSTVSNDLLYHGQTKEITFNTHP